MRFEACPPKLYAKAGSRFKVPDFRFHIPEKANSPQGTQGDTGLNPGSGINS